MRACCYNVHFAIPSSNLFTFSNGFLFTIFAFSMAGTFNVWMQMHHSIVDNTNIEKQRSKSNLIKTKGWIQGAFNVDSKFQVSMLIKHCKKMGSCGLNIFNVCTNVIFKFVFHFQSLILFFSVFNNSMFFAFQAFGFPKTNVYIWVSVLWIHLRSLFFTPNTFANLLII
jgi:hypothetical protein